MMTTRNVDRIDSLTYLSDVDVVVYSRPGCMFCSQVEGLLRSAGVKFESLEITSRDEQDDLMSHHDARSFPVVLVGGKYLGGFTHIVKLHAEGRLQRIGADPETSLPHAPSQRLPLPPSRRPSDIPGDARRGTLAELAKLGEYLKRQKGGS